MTNDQFSKTKFIAAAGLIAFGAITRYLLKDLPNIETITVVSLLAGALLGGVWTVIVGLSVVAITDIFIGNTNILLYTWTAWAVMGALGLAARRFRRKPWAFSAGLTGLGLTGNVFFYLWTNFGVWHIGDLYPHSAAGLLDSYIMGLPFLGYQLISTVVFVPVLSAVALAAWNTFAQTASSVTPPLAASPALIIKT